MAKTIGKLSSLQWALEQLADQPQQPDEFTAVEFWQQANAHDPTVTIAAVRGRLQRAVEQGQIKSRKGTIHGKQGKFYRKP